MTRRVKRQQVASWRIGSGDGRCRGASLQGRPFGIRWAQLWPVQPALADGISSAIWARLTE